MKIKHYLYNTFIIENDRIKIAVDPGQNLYLFKLGSLIPKSEWYTISHILITHGDPDHYWQANRVAETANAPIICGKNLVKTKDSKTYLVGPRSRGIKYDTPVEKVYPLDVGEVIHFEEFQVRGVKAVHGSIQLKLFGLIKLEINPGPDERIGLGAMGFEIKFDNTVMVNLGDTLLQEDWESLNPDILMIPIGGKKIHNTMNEAEALEAVEMMSPKLVIPCHYNCGVF